MSNGKTVVEIDLKSCPFCGSKDVKVTHVFYDESRKAVQCRKCGVRTDFYSNVKDAVNVWNRRGGVG